MHSYISILTLVCLLAAVQFQPVDSHLPEILKSKALGKGSSGKDASGTALAAVMSSRKLGLGLGLKAILLKPLLLVALAKIKLALLLGKPLALLALKKLLLKKLLGKLLLKIPLILLKGKGLLVKMLALKFALVTKGLIGLKAPLAMLFLGACALGSGLGLALALGATLHKLKEQDSYEDDYGYEESYALPPPPAYGPPQSYSASYVQSNGGGYGGEYAASQIGSFATAPIPSVGAGFLGANSQNIHGGGGAVNNGFGGSYSGRRKRDAEDSSESTSNISDNESTEEIDDSVEESDDESSEDIQLEFEAARTNGNAYLYMAAQLDEQSCGRRLMCEIYQKPHDSLTEDEVLLQDIFGYPLPLLSQEDEGTPKELYYRAAQIGASYQGRSSSRVCARFYSTCQYNSQELINIFVTEDVQTNEIDDDDEPSAHLKPPSSSANLPFPFFVYPRQHLNTSPSSTFYLQKPAVASPTHTPLQKPHQQLQQGIQARQYQQTISLPFMPKQRFISLPPVA